MNVRTVSIAVAAAIVGAVAGVLGYVWVMGGSSQPSQVTTAPTLDVNAVPTLNADQAFAAATQVAQLSSQVKDLQATIAAQSAAPTTAASAPTAAAAAATAAPAAAARTLYRINAEASEVQFFLKEDLSGVRTDVIGKTKDVAGDIIVDFGNPAASQVGTIRINARTLATNNEFRNRALRSDILKSSRDEFEFVEFVPTALTGLPATIEAGESYDVEISGDLRIVGQTKLVTFKAQVTLESEARLTGTASVNVVYADWGITIPSVPRVANVTPDVTLTITFSADKVAQ
jgi:polyisoprenoid-binding protein YceI